MTMQERTDAVVAAWKALVGRGDIPTVRTVLKQMRDIDGRGASLRDIVPLVAELRSESEADPRIVEVVCIYLSLDPVARREALRRMKSEERK